MTDASMFTTAALTVTSTGLATGITLRVLHRSTAPMLALIIAGGMLQIPASALKHDWFDVFWGLGITLACLGLLTWDAAKARP